MYYNFPSRSIGLTSMANVYQHRNYLYINLLKCKISSHTCFNINLSYLICYGKIIHSRVQVPLQASFFQILTQMSLYVFLQVAVCTILMESIQNNGFFVTIFLISLLLHLFTYYLYTVYLMFYMLCILFSLIRPHKLQENGVFKTIST